MKLIFEETNQAIFEQEMNESTGKSVYKISGIFSTIGEKNKNGRVYPANIWEREIKAYQDVLANGSSNTLMELNHPPRANVEMMEAVAKINKLYIEGKYVMGEAVLLNNPMANQLKSLIDAGVKMSVSSRGVGKVSATGMVENFKLSTYDIIPDQGQSDYNAQMMGIVEGVLESKEFEILADGCVGECKLPSVNEDTNSEFPNVTDMKAILEKEGAEVLCDLDKETKEKVLKEFRYADIDESFNSLVEKNIINKKQALWFLDLIRKSKSLDELEDDVSIMAKLTESDTTELISLKEELNIVTELAESTKSTSDETLVKLTESETKHAALLEELEAYKTYVTEEVTKLEEENEALKVENEALKVENEELDIKKTIYNENKQKTNSQVLNKTKEIFSGLLD